MKKFETCRISGKPLKQIFSFGELANSDFVKDQDNIEKFPMNIMYCEESGLMQLEHSIDLSKMFGKYWYRSGTNQTMVKELKDIVDNILKVKKLKDNDLWVEIACNDGSLLKNIPTNIKRLGIDPADSSFVQESSKYADEIIQDFFNIDSYKRSIFSDRKASVINAIAMFYDLDDPKQFLNDVNAVLDDNGLFVIQLSYTPLMIQQMAFDNFCFEHVTYYTLTNLKLLLESVDMKIVDCQLNDVNGGSFRVFIQKNIADVKSFSTAPNRDVCNFRVQSILEYEKSLNMNFDYYKRFFDKVLELKEKTYNFIKSEKEKGKKIWIYGASTKGNTLLQFFNLDKNIIDGAAERSHYKFGLKTVSTDIQIYSEEIMRSENPDYLLILPWHFIDEFVDREQEYLNSGGKFIVPCPNFEII